MIAIKGLATVGHIVATDRRSDGAATNYEIVWLTTVLRDREGHGGCLARMDLVHRRLWTDVVLRAQSGYRADACIPARVGEQS